jgi:hypothetical protein
MWKADKIKQLEARISTYQHELVVRLLAYLDAKTDQYAAAQGDQLRNLEDNDARFLEVTESAHISREG